MLLADIGNTNIKLWRDGVVTRQDAIAALLPSTPFCYINVNPDLDGALKRLDHAQDIAPYFRFETSYRGLGVDRIAACYTVDTGVVVDAGSAITVDVMDSGRHFGGFILPGIRSCKESFVNISPKLVCDLNPSIDLTQLPNTTNDALNYAIFGSIVSLIRTHTKGKRIYLTGGDAKQLYKLLPEATVVPDLVFRGMQKAIKEKGISC